ncbi:porin [Sulfurovum riftiae]|uniref:Porin domain-containing protein n=1 Tax=Sulfurovum riftiae TaxID=1630136 RepID=A0A151CE83_9BACT|nr:porin [Sulfurovum riftiae]KYJ85840.1 hypothetical protein AS592_04415 [Sulfurovum riftiae]
MVRFLFLLLFLFVHTSLYGQSPQYKLGHGLQIGDLPLYAGGYFSLEYEDVFDQYRSLKLEDVSLMLYGEKENFSYMLELEANDVYSEVFGNEDADAVNEHFHIERLYVDYAVNENYAFRAGKYISPVGFWNRISINVLRDTTSNPRISRFLFPQFTSGLDLKYNTNSANELSFDVMAQETEDMDTLVSNEIYNNFETDRHYGIGMSFSRDDIFYQFNAGYFRTVNEKQFYYVQGAFTYTKDAFRLQSEVGRQFDDDGTTIPYIGYIQGVYTLKEKHELIVRFESYSDTTIDTKDSFAVFGYTYRPLYPIAIKGEYQWHSLHDENSLFLSLSVLF